MKKALLTLIALSVSVSLFAQGTVVFSNVGSGKPVQWDGDNNGVGDRALTATDGVQVSLWVAPAGTTDPNAAAWQLMGAPANIIGSGLFSAGDRTVPQAENVTYSFQVRAWQTSIYGSTATGWADATKVAGAKVTTAGPIIQSVTGGWGTPASVSVNLAPLFGAAPNIIVGTVVPEPSVFALGVLGVGALLMLRRRK